MDVLLFIALSGLILLDDRNGVVPETEHATKSQRIFLLETGPDV